jgi:hypothetical protein
MRTNRDTTEHAKDRGVWAPYMVINPGETIPEAMARHRRETGHRGGCICVGVNDGRSSLAIG